MLPDTRGYREEIRTRLDQWGCIFERNSANRNTRQFRPDVPPTQQSDLGGMDNLLGSGGIKSTKSNIIRPCLSRFKRQMAATVAGNADLDLWPQIRTRFAQIAVLLAQMDPVRSEPLGQADRIIDDESHITRLAYPLERLCKDRRCMIVHAFDAKLERRNGRIFAMGIQRAGEHFGKGTAHFERRDEIELAFGHGGFPSAHPGILEPFIALVRYSRMKQLALIPLLALTLTGCVTYRTNGDGITRARFGESVRVDGPQVTPLKLLEDSRCPEGVQCVWAGQVRISAAISLGSRVEQVEITQGEPIPVADGTLELVEVMPRRQANVTLYPDDYRFGFRFSGGL
jgi:hypothetical protein